MATTNPGFIDGIDYSALEFRRLSNIGKASYGGSELVLRNGVYPGGNAWQVTTAGSPVVATITKGPGIVDGPSGSGTGYMVVLESDEQQTLTAAAVQPRIDILIVEVTGFIGQTRLITGTAAATPATPATPTGAFKIATLSVAASGSGGAVTTASNLQFTVARGGILPVSGALPTVHTYPGMAAYDVGSDALSVRNAANNAYNLVYQVPQTGSFDTVAGWPGDTGASQRTARYVLSPSTAFVSFQGRLLRAVSNFSWTGGAWVSFTNALPANIRPSGACYFTIATSQGPGLARYWPADNMLYGQMTSTTTWVSGTDWLALDAIQYKL